MRRAGCLLLALVATAATPRVPRSTMQSIERSLDQRIQRFSIEDPIELLGTTRGVYLERYGAVFTAEVNLVVTAVTPFRPQLTAEEKEKLRQKKLSRLPQIKQIMRDILVHSGASLKTVPDTEQIVVGMHFFNAPWEITTGLPSQLLMQAPRKTLSDYEAGRIQKAALEAGILEQVF